jgi:hypothetical protein
MDQESGREVSRPRVDGRKSKKSEVIELREFDMSKLDLSSKCVIIGKPGTGKCLTPGTRIKMASGIVKSCEDIVSGDLIMGWDLKPRTVASTCRGREKMYKIVQSDGMDYVVNESHILTLLNTKGNLENICLRDLLPVIDGLPTLAPLRGLRVENPNSSSRSQKYIISNIRIKPQNVGDYYGFELEEDDKKFLLEDGTITHNTNLILDIANYTKDRIPVASIQSGSEEENLTYEKFFPSIFVHNRYKADNMNKIKSRQKYLKTIKHPNGRVLTVVDDCNEIKKIFNTKEQLEKFQKARHWNDLYVLGIHYGIGITTDIRTLIDYSFIFKEKQPNVRKKLFENYAGPVGTFKRFNKIMDEIGDYNCLVINNRTQSTEFHDIVSYYKAEEHDPENPDFQFGCNEAWAWDELRRDPNFVYED